MTESRDKGINGSRRDPSTLARFAASRTPSSVFTAINSVAENLGAPSNAVRYNLFKLARGLFMKKLRRGGESTFDGELAR